MEIGELTIIFSWTSEQENTETILINPDLLNGHRDLAYARMTAQKKIIERYYNRRANFHFFKIGDLIIRKVTHNIRGVNAEKLGLN